MTRCRAPTRTIPRSADVPPSRRRRARATGSRGCASPGSAAISRAAASRRPSRRSSASPRRSASTRTRRIAGGRARARRRLSHHHGRRRGAAPRPAARRARGDFDPDVRDRLIAGAMLPGAWVVKAQKFRSWFRAQALEMFRDVDVLLAPATPCRAPRIGQKTFVLDGKEMLVRPNIGAVHPADLLHRPARRRRSGLDRRRARCRSACRSSRRPGARISRCASRARWSARASSRAHGAVG